MSRILTNNDQIKHQEPFAGHLGSPRQPVSGSRHSSRGIVRRGITEVRPTAAESSWEGECQVAHHVTTTTCGSRRLRTLAVGRPSALAERTHARRTNRPLESRLPTCLGRPKSGLGQEREHGFSGISLGRSLAALQSGRPLFLLFVCFPFLRNQYLMIRQTG